MTATVHPTNGSTRPLALGTTLKGRYRVTRLVAGGGMAWVYEVEETRADGSRGVWAMKELRVDPDDTHTLAESRAMFAQEANILVALSHPNLPQVSAFFDEQGRSYLIMEFIHGESLEKRLERANAPLLESEVLDWAVQVCDVLVYLHGQPLPVIFRDLKPSNVMVTLEGRVKLIDFGIARTFKSGQRRDTVTMGSENYAAPEQWGQAQTDARADIYGLGATMYHLLTNVPPLPAFVPTPRVPVIQYNAAVSDATVAAIERAMSPDRTGRYPTAAAMRAALLDCVPRRERRRMEQRSAEVSGALPLNGATAAPAPVLARPPDRPAETPSAQAVTVSAAPPVAVTPVSPEVMVPLPGAEAPLRDWEDGALPVDPAPAEVEPAPAVRVCPQCHTENGRAARYCRHCGYALVPPLPPALVLLRPPEAHWEYPLRERDVLVGRPGGAEATDLDLAFYDPQGYVSRNHARLVAGGRRYQLIDLGSANGTFVNGERLSPHVPRLLRQGDRIRLGRIVLEFRIR